MITINQHVLVKYNTSKTTGVSYILATYFDAATNSVKRKQLRKTRNYGTSAERQMQDAGASLLRINDPALVGHPLTAVRTKQDGSEIIVHA